MFICICSCSEMDYDGNKYKFTAQMPDINNDICIPNLASKSKPRTKQRETIKRKK